MDDYEALSHLTLWERQARVRRLQDELADCYLNVRLPKVWRNSILWEVFEMAEKTNAIQKTCGGW